MTTICDVTAKAPRLASSRAPAAPVPPKQPHPAEQAAALHRSEAHYRRARHAIETSFLLNGGRYL